MTATLQCAVDPSDPADDSRDPKTCVRPGHFLRSQLGRALLLQLHGEPKSAALELGAIDQGTVAQAIDVLTEATAVALSQLNQRAEYPIPIHHVVDRLQAVGAPDLDVSIELLHRAVLANAGAHLPVEELIHTYGPGSALYGAFDATAAVIRFAGQRRWRPTAEILTELGFGEHGSIRQLA